MKSKRLKKQLDRNKIQKPTTLDSKGKLVRQRMAWQMYDKYPNFFDKPSFPRT